MRRFAELADRLVGQPMFQMAGRIRAMEQGGRQIYHFEIGDSDAPADQHLIDATKQALDADRTHYGDSRGTWELRQAICDYIAETLGFRPDLEQVLVMPANAIVDACLRVVADPGDEVLSPDPGFSTYQAVAYYAGIHQVGVPLYEEQGFCMRAEEIAPRITERTRLLIMNSPHNPTGAVIPCDEVERIARLAEDADLFLLSDEIYSCITYDHHEHVSPACWDHCRERTLLLNGFTKNYGMPGWRLGYAIGPRELIDKMATLFETMYSCIPAFVQAAGVVALRGDQRPLQERVRRYQRCRRLMVEKLNELPGVACAMPAGACYVFPNIRGTGMTSEQFAAFALEQADVALLPGTCFGENGQGYVRLCCTHSPEVIEAACESLKSALAANELSV